MSKYVINYYVIIVAASLWKSERQEGLGGQCLLRRSGNRLIRYGGISRDALLWMALWLVSQPTLGI
jgi:hypothetical protein